MTIHDRTRSTGCTLRLLLSWESSHFSGIFPFAFRSSLSSWGSTWICLGKSFPHSPHSPHFRVAGYAEVRGMTYLARGRVWSCLFFFFNPSFSTFSTASLFCAAPKLDSLQLSADPSIDTNVYKGFLVHNSHLIGNLLASSIQFLDPDMIALALCRSPSRDNEPSGPWHIEQSSTY